MRALRATTLVFALLWVERLAFSQGLESGLAALKTNLSTANPAAIGDRFRSICANPESMQRCEQWTLTAADVLQTQADSRAFETEVALLGATRDLRHDAIGPDSENVQVLLALGEAYCYLANYRLAEPLFLRALEVLKERGAENMMTAAALNDLAMVHESNNDYPKAIEFHRQALELRRKLFGARSSQVAESLINLADVYETIGELRTAEPMNREAVSILEGIDPDSHTIGVALMALGELLLTEGKFAEAETFGKRAVAIMEKSGENADTAKALDNLASVYGEQDLYDKAKPLRLRAVKIIESAFGLEHPDTALAIYNLGTLYYNLGEYGNAEKSYQQSLDIREKVLSAGHPEIAASMDALAQTWMILGEYEKAEPMHLRALALSEKARGTNHADTARTLNNLGVLYLSEGRYAESERMLTRAASIYEAALPANHPLIASALGNLAFLYRSQGAYAKAEPLARRVLEMREKSLGPNNRQTAASLNNLAELFRARKNYAAAESYGQRALTALANALPPGHPDIAIALNNVANLYLDEGEFEKAKPLLDRALAIQSAALGEDHPDEANTLNALARLHFAEKDFAGAQDYYARSLAIFEKSATLDSPDAISTRVDNARALWQIGRRVEARYQLMEANRELVRFWSDALIGVEAGRRRALVEKFDHLLPLSLSIAEQLSRDDPDGAAELAALAILARKGVQSSAQQEVIARLRREQSRESLTWLRDLMTNTELQGRAARLPGPESQMRLRQLRDEENGIEQKLIAASAAFRQWRTPVEPALVSRLLAPGSVLIDVLRYPRLNTETGGLAEFDYAAVMYRSHRNPKLVSLGAAKPIDDAVAALRSNFDNVWTTCLPEDRCAEGVRTRLKKGAAFEENLRKTEADCETLYRLTLAKLLPAAEGRKRLLISPDGALAEIPWEILRNGGYIIEKGYRISYLDSARNIVDRQLTGGARGPAVVIANVDYDGKPIVATVPPRAGSPAEATRAELRIDEFLVQPEERPAGFDVKWPPLNGGSEILRTLADLHRQGKIAEVQKLPHGSEDEVIALRQPLAIFAHTHGFFNPQSFNGRLAPDSGDLESGIVLYGANRADERGRLGRDGWLTAKEVMLLHLEGTQLVALLGCDTGRGVEAGEGVRGLRHALAVAGARSTLLTLWDVGDLSSARFLRELVTRLAANSQTTLTEALTQVRLAFLAGAMREGDSTSVDSRWRHPYFWGAATLSGRDDPLNLKVRGEGTPPAGLR